MDPPAESLTLELGSAEATIERVGGKGASLARLAAAGLPVPPGFHITTLAYCRFVSEHGLGKAIASAAMQAAPADPALLDHAAAQIQSLFAAAPILEEIAAAIRGRYGELDGPSVAVRSSATTEDLSELSFAGQHETFLNVSGADRVLTAVRRCWASLWTARAIGYRAQHDIAPEEVSLAVVVQELVPADAAGILFTANPVTGARDQIVINAAWGLGEAIVGGLVTPDTLIMDSGTGAIISQDIADKAVMTVRSPEGTCEAPVPAKKRAQPALQPQQAAELARLGAQIEHLYGQPMDVEWALWAGRLYVLQARPITALAEPPVTLDWTLPRPHLRYVRSSVIELLPDPLSPLFATLALPIWNDEMRNLAQTLAFLRTLADQLRLVTINDYAYYEYGFSGWQSLRMALGLLGGIRSIARMLRRAQVRWAEEARPRYAEIVARWAARDLTAAPAEQLLDGAIEIVKAAAEHYLAVQSGILPVAYMSEALFTSVYDRFLKRKGDPPALTFLLGFDSAPILAEKSLYNLASWSQEHPALADYLERATGEEIAAAYQSESTSIAGAESWREFRQRFTEHLECFGHAVYDLDFAKPLPADDPAPLLGALKHFLSGQARSPYERQSAAAAAREQAMRSVRTHLGGLRKRLFTSLVQPAQRYAPLREDALADVGLGWPLLHRMFRALGRRLVAANALDGADDLFWLTWNEAREAAHALSAEDPARDHRDEVAERRAVWERESRAMPPAILPVRGGLRFLGFDVTRWMPARTDQAAGNTIKGIGASPGRVTGPACVLRGPADFGRMQPGEILVAKITTPAWTPLFALAGGVVTDVGGPLSHSSIVAREYHIPAVLGTGVATECIRSGQTITVDGDAGRVRVDR